MKSWPWLVGAFVVLAIIGVLWGWRERRYQDALDHQQQIAHSADSTAQAAVAEFKAKEAALRPVIVERMRRDTIILRRVTTLPPSPAPVCDSVVAQRDTVIHQLETSVVTWTDIAEKQRAASARLLAADSARANEVVGLNKEIDLLKHPPGTSLLGRLLRPKVKPGVFAGLCTDGKPCLGLGVTVSF